MLAEHGEQRTAEVGEELFRIGDATYLFIAIFEGEAAVLDGAGQEISATGCCSRTRRSRASSCRHSWRDANCCSSGREPGSRSSARGTRRRRANSSTQKDGFVLTGSDAGVEGLLETSVPRTYAAGDVRSGSIKRWATAVGEGAAVVRFVHEHLEPKQLSPRSPT